MRTARLVPVRDRLGEHWCPQRGHLTGSNPPERGKKGSQKSATARACRSRSRSWARTCTKARHWNLWLEVSHRSARAVGHVGVVRPNCTAIRATTMVICADGCASAASCRGSPAVVSSPSNASAAIAGSWNAMSWLADCRRLHRRYERKAVHCLTFWVFRRPSSASAASSVRTRRTGQRRDSWFVRPSGRFGRAS